MNSPRSFHYILNILIILFAFSTTAATSPENNEGSILVEHQSVSGSTFAQAETGTPNTAVQVTETPKAAVQEVETTGAVVQEVETTGAVVQEAETTGAVVQEAETTEAVTVGNVWDEAVSVDSTDDSASTEPVIVPGTIIVTSIPDSAGIIINDINVGLTPYHASGFYPGIYDVMIFKNGFESYVKTIDLQSGGTEFITGGLSPETGRFFVSCLPESATVFINDTISGITPFQSKPLLPGDYHLRIEAPNHTTYAETLSILPKLVDSIQVTLTSIKKPFLPAFSNLKTSRNLRRISFGVVALGTTVTGILLNQKTITCLDNEDYVYHNYNVRGLSEEEYDERYSAYIDATKKTDRYAMMRNIFYTIGIITGTGLTVSIFY